MTFLHLRNKFKNLSEAKVKEGDFIGPQIKALFEKKCQASLKISSKVFENNYKKQPGQHSNEKKR